MESLFSEFKTDGRGDSRISGVHSGLESKQAERSDKVDDKEGDQIIARGPLSPNPGVRPEGPSERPFILHRQWGHTTDQYLRFDNIYKSDDGEAYITLPSDSNDLQRSLTWPGPTNQSRMHK